MNIENNSWDKVTEEEFDCWLEDNWNRLTYPFFFKLINEYKTHAIPDLKHEIKTWKQKKEREADLDKPFAEWKCNLKLKQKGKQ